MNTYTLSVIAALFMGIAGFFTAPDAENSAPAPVDCEVVFSVDGEDATSLHLASFEIDSVKEGVKCCKICTTGKACGNTCINRNYNCSRPPGCACNG
jgi:hypothetical protein